MSRLKKAGRTPWLLSTGLVILLCSTGCSVARTAGKEAAQGAWDFAQAELSKRVDALSARADALAGETNAKIEAATPSLILRTRDALTPQINSAIDAGAEKLQAGFDAKLAEIKAKRDSGQPLTPLEWFYLALGASGLGAGGIKMGNALLRKVLGTTMPVDHEEIAKAVVAALPVPPKPS